MTIDEKVEEFDRLYRCEYRWEKDRINQPDAVDYLTNLLQQVEEESKAEKKNLIEALIWCSGSSDFNRGKARDGWLKICAPLISEHYESEESKKYNELIDDYVSSDIANNE